MTSASELHEEAVFGKANSITARCFAHASSIDVPIFVSLESGQSL